MTYEPQKGLSHARMYRTRKTRGAVRSQPDSRVVMLGVWPVPDSRPATACNVAPVPVARGQRPSEKILAKPMAVGLGRPRPAVGLLAYPGREGAWDPSWPPSVRPPPHCSLQARGCVSRGGCCQAEAPGERRKAAEFQIRTFWSCAFIFVLNFFFLLLR